MQFKITNISKGPTPPAGIQLEWTDQPSKEKRRVSPGKFALVDKLHEVHFNWQAKGWAKIDKMTDPMVEASTAVANKQMPAQVNQVQLAPDDGSDPLVQDLMEPDIDTGNAQEAQLPSDTLIENTDPINQSTAQIQKEGAQTAPDNNKSGAKVRVNSKEKRTSEQGKGFKTSQMGTQPTQKIGKDSEIDAMNPLLDESAKSVDNTDDAFNVTAPDRSKNETGTTITT